MKRNDAVYLSAVIGCALVFVAVTAGQIMDPSEAGTEGAAAEASAAGRPRPVDVEKMKALIERGQLSGHEAEYYEPVPEGPPNEERPPAEAGGRP